MLHLVAVMVGITSALFFSAIKKQNSTGAKFRGGRTSQTRFARSSAASGNGLDQQKVQKQAELLLARAVKLDDGAAGEIESQAESWRGKLQWDAQLSDLTTVALNSNDASVRSSAIEVQLAAYGLNKNSATVDGLVRQAGSADHAQKIWSLWSLGLLGNRGIETDRVVQALTAQLKGRGKDSNEDSRRWAVEGLALVGTNATITPLLDALRQDPSALVRERAACSLAQSGMLTHDQRLTAVPQLIADSDDPALDAQTHAWAFQALSDITRQPLQRDSAAWRKWYQTAEAGR